MANKSHADGPNTIRTRAEKMDAANGISTFFNPVSSISSGSYVLKTHTARGVRSKHVS